KNEVVQLFARADGESAEGFNLIRLAVTEEGPDLARGLLDETAIFEVAHEASLVNSVERADSHRNCGETPEIGHEPWVRIGRETRLAAQLVAEVLQVLVGEAAFKISAGIDSGRGVTLDRKSV